MVHHHKTTIAPSGATPALAPKTHASDTHQLRYTYLQISSSKQDFSTLHSARRTTPATGIHGSRGCVHFFGEVKIRTTEQDQGRKGTCSIRNRASELYRTTAKCVYLVYLLRSGSKHPPEAIKSEGSEAAEELMKMRIISKEATPAPTEPGLVYTLFLLYSADPIQGRATTVLATRKASLLDGRVRRQKKDGDQKSPNIQYVINAGGWIRSKYSDGEASSFVMTGYSS